MILHNKRSSSTEGAKDSHSSQGLLSDMRKVIHDGLSSFHMGPAGIGGQIDPIQRYLGSLHRVEGAEAQLLSLCSSPNKAVRLYGLLGLKIVGSSHFDQEFAKLSVDQDEIESISGCFGFTASVARFAKEIDKDDVQWLIKLASPDAGK